MQFERGAHAPSRAVGGDLADHTQAEDAPALGDSPVSGPTGEGRRSEHAGGACAPHLLLHGWLSGGKFLCGALVFKLPGQNFVFAESFREL